MVRSFFASLFILAISFFVFASAQQQQQQQQIPEHFLKLDEDKQRILQERMAHLRNEEAMEQKMKQALGVLANDALVQAKKVTTADIEEEHERQRRQRRATKQEKMMPDAERINREILEKMAALHGR